MREVTDLTHLAHSGAKIAVRVHPGASRNAVTLDDAGKISVRVTVVAEGGKANEAVRKLLAKALGVPKSHLALLHGAKARDKVFGIES